MYIFIIILLYILFIYIILFYLLYILLYICYIFIILYYFISIYFSRLKGKPPQEWAKAFKEAKQWAQEVSCIDISRMNQKAIVLLKKKNNNNIHIRNQHIFYFNNFFIILISVCCYFIYSKMQFAFFDVFSYKTFALL